MYNSYFLRSLDPLAYENNWAFVVQEARFGGFCYDGEDVLLTAVSRHSQSPFLFVFPPLGQLYGFLDTVERIVEELRAVTGRRIVMRKLLPELAGALMAKGTFASLSPAEFSHPRDVPEDVFPQVIISVAETLALATPNFVKTRNQIQHFTDTWPAHRVLDLTSEAKTDVADLAERWDGAYQARRAARLIDDVTKADTTAYTIFADAFGSRIDHDRFFSKLLYVNTQAIGFSFAGRVSPVGAALYCNLTLREFRGAAEYLLLTLLDDLMAAGVQYLNLGGSETEGLFAFKRKLAPKELRNATDVEFVPNVRGSPHDVTGL